MLKRQLKAKPTFKAYDELRVVGFVEGFIIEYSIRSIDDPQTKRVLDLKIEAEWNK